MRKGLLYLCLVVFWIGVIFSLSNDTAEISSKKSKALTNIVSREMGSVGEMFNLEFNGNTNSLHNNIRVLGHGLEYFTLTFFVIILLHKVKFSIKYIYCIAWLIPTIISIIDEYNQSFVPGRGSEFRDVVVDNIGVIACLILYYIYSKIVRVIKEVKANS